MISLPWIVENDVARVSAEDCMDNNSEEFYYRACARHTITQNIVFGTGASVEEAKETLEKNIQKLDNQEARAKKKMLPSELTDAQLGAQVRDVLKRFPKEFETEAAMASACLMMIAYFGHCLKAEELKISIEDVTHSEDEGFTKIGSWSAVITRTKKPIE